MTELEILGDVCYAVSELDEKIRIYQETYLDYDEEDIAPELEEVFYIHLHTRDHDELFENTDELISYLFAHSSFHETSYISFDYEPFNVPPGTKCTLTFRDMQSIVSFLTKTSICSVVKRIVES